MSFRDIFQDLTTRLHNDFSLQGVSIEYENAPATSTGTSWIRPQLRFSSPEQASYGTTGRIEGNMFIECYMTKDVGYGGLLSLQDEISRLFGQQVIGSTHVGLVRLDILGVRDDYYRATIAVPFTKYEVMA